MGSLLYVDLSMDDRHEGFERGLDRIAKEVQDRQKHLAALPRNTVLPSSAFPRAAQEAEAKKKAAEEDARIKAKKEEEAAEERAAAEAQAQAEAAAKKKEEEEAAQRKAAEEALQVAQAEAAAKKGEEEETLKRKAAAEALAAAGAASAAAQSKAEAAAKEEEEEEGEIELPEIVHRKLHDPSLSLSPEDSLKVLLSCIKYGAVKGRKAKGKELLMVIGNTGAGKSTLINFQCVANVLLTCC